MQDINLRRIREGKVLRNSKGVVSFYFLGKLYTTNRYRALKTTKGPYSFDDDGWRLTNLGLFYKLKAIYRKDVVAFR